MTTSNRDDTNWVRLVVHGDYDVYQELKRIVKIAKFDEDDQTWANVDEATRNLAHYVRELDPDAPGLSDLRKVTFDQVDWRTLLEEELEQINLDEDREDRCGL